MKQPMITKDIESPNKVTKHIEIKDFFFLIFWVGITFIFQGQVADKLKPIYYIFSFLVGLFLTSKSTWNKKRRNYASLILMLNADTRTYKAIYFKEKGE